MSRAGGHRRKRAVRVTLEPWASPSADSAGLVSGDERSDAEAGCPEAKPDEAGQRNVPVLEDTRRKWRSITSSIRCVGRRVEPPHRIVRQLLESPDRCPRHRMGALPLADVRDIAQGHARENLRRQRSGWVGCVGRKVSEGAAAIVRRNSSASASNSDQSMATSSVRGWGPPGRCRAIGRGGVYLGGRVAWLLDTIDLHYGDAVRWLRSKLANRESAGT